MRSGAFKIHTAGPALFDINPYKGEGDGKGASKEKEVEKGEKKKLMPFYRGRPGLGIDHGKYFGTFDHYPAHSDEPPAERVSMSCIDVYLAYISLFTGTIDSG